MKFALVTGVQTCALPISILLQCKAEKEDSRRPPDPVPTAPSRGQAPSLSKGSPFSKMGKEERPFDKLGANGKGIDIHGCDDSDDDGRRHRNRGLSRSEERRGGNECVRTCRSLWSS